MLLSLLFPKKCVGCKKLGTYFCTSCIANVKQRQLICPICKDSAMGGQTHPLCKTRFGLDGLWSLGIYEGGLRSAVQQLKYKFVKNLAEVLVNIVVEYWAIYQPFLLDNIKKDYGRGWVIIPVPLHNFRQNWRGFNQSKLLGQLLSKKLGLDYSDCLKRIRYTKPQAKLKSFERKKNIKDAFAVNSNYKPLTMNYVLLVDDVWTTGSTMKECCYILKKAGAKQVWALTLAR